MNDDVLVIDKITDEKQYTPTPHKYTINNVIFIDILRENIEKLMQRWWLNSSKSFVYR